MEERDEQSIAATGSKEVESWIFSLTPVGVAFLFYVVFILQANLENSSFFIAFGATAGFIGLESYWILHGWRKKRNNIVMMGFVGIAITLALFYLLFMG